MTVCFFDFAEWFGRGASAIRPRGSPGRFQAWRKRCSFRSCFEIAGVSSVGSLLHFGGVGL